MTEPCPSELALDDAELHGGEAAARLAAHVAACARCQARREERRRLTERFDQAYARTGWRHVAAATQQPPARRRRPWGWLAIALPVAAAGAFLLARAADLRPLPPYAGVKGALAVTVAARRDGRVFPIDGATALRAGDQVQLSVRTGAAGGRYVVAGSVDGTGRFSPFYPPSVHDAAQSVPLPAGGGALAPPVVLDAAPGPERILVLVSERPIAVAAVGPLAESAAPSSAPIEAVSGVPVTSAWITVAKEAAAAATPR